jgi:hypothetical protein
MAGFGDHAKTLNQLGLLGSASSTIAGSGGNSFRGLFGLAPPKPDRFQVWVKGRELAGNDPTLWRMDDAGNAIYLHAYGDQSSPYGWQIDHITPTALGGTDDLWNLRPMHCKKNASMGGILGNLLSRPGG